jgi:hypothetical protein
MLCPHFKFVAPDFFHNLEDYSMVNVKLGMMRTIVRC